VSAHLKGGLGVITRSGDKPKFTDGARLTAADKGRLSDADNYASGGRWIQKAIKHPGAHRQLGVPQGEKIPAKKLERAAHSDNPTLRRRAVLAKTLKGM
jgi:hypothetical protein